MNNQPDYLLFFIMIASIVLIAWNVHDIEKLQSEIKTIKTESHVIESECEEILQYKQFGRIDFVCYMGDDYNYSVNEKRVIEQWNKKSK